MGHKRRVELQSIPANSSRLDPSGTSVRNQTCTGSEGEKRPRQQNIGRTGERGGGSLTGGSERLGAEVADAALPRHEHELVRVRAERRRVAVCQHTNARAQNEWTRSLAREANRLQWALCLT